MVSRNTMKADGERTDYHVARWWEGRAVCYLCRESDLTLYEAQTGYCQNLVGATERAAMSILAVRQ